MNCDIITVTMNPTIDRVMAVPGFQIGGHLRGQIRSRTAAGKAFNVSRALGSLGVGNTATGWIGAEALGFFERAARAAGVVPRFVPIAALTRENITILDPAGGSETHIRDAGPVITAEEYDRLKSELSICAHPNAVFVFSGSTAPGVSTAAFGALIDACTNRGARVAIDTSLEPLVEAAAREVWMIKPNLLELTNLTGVSPTNDGAVVAAARELHRRIPIVVVTLGERGAYCLADGRALRGRAAVPRERIRSTVGCGDAFMAGFLAEICSPAGTPESAFRQALAVAAASAMSDLPATFTREEVQWSMQRVEVEAMPPPASTRS